jgi:MFS family permease
MAADEVIEREVLPAPVRFRIMLTGGAIYMLISLAAPFSGLVSIPLTFFLKNRLHLASHQVALFNLWVTLPIFVGFIFGFLRDRWSPFGAGDRGHLVIFGGASAVVYGVLAFLNPTYAVLLAGVLLITAVSQTALSAAAGLTSTIGQQHAMAGQMSTTLVFATSFTAFAAYLIGGLLSDFIEGKAAAAAARILFLVAGAIMGLVAVFGVVGPRQLFEAARRERSTNTALADVARLLKHWPIYPVLLSQLLWQFAPATGIVLQFHMSNTLHASDAQWGEWNGIFSVTFLPVYLLYGWLCQRVNLGWLLWVGAVITVFQMVPLLFIHTPTGALIAAAPMGATGAIAAAALTDLAIRSCPPGLQGTMMMLYAAMYWIAVRLGDLWGTDLYDHHGGFITATLATIAVYALVLPVLLFVPRRLLATKDGEHIAL